MDFFNIFNKFSGKVTNYFSYIENSIQRPQNQISDNLIKFNENIILWINDNNYLDCEYINLIIKDYKNDFLIYNITPRKIETNIDQDKIVDFKLPNNPSFTLEFLISFCISAENWLISENSHKLIIHDDPSINEGKIFYLLSAVISYNNSKKTDSLYEPVSIYADLTSSLNSNENFKNIDILSDTKNNIRYLNYFSAIQKSPLISLKKIFLTNIMISGAPAIDNKENKDGPFVTINKNSFYIPIIRIKSNNKYIYSSYNQNSSDNQLIKMFHSEDNVVKFCINKYIFNDILIEVLHKGEKSFKLLFTIQFNSFFITSNYSIKFSRDQIDSIHKDIRYPTDFFVDLHFDNEKEEKLSSFDDYSILWKSLLSEFISKSLSNVTNNDYNFIEEKKESENKENTSEDIKDNDNDKNKYEINENIDDDLDVNLNIENINNKGKKEKNKNKDEEMLEIGNTNNTLAQVNNLLKQIEGKNNKIEDEQEDDQDDEDIEKYLKSLENK